jgi:hypothetical protein
MDIEESSSIRRSVLPLCDHYGPSIEIFAIKREDTQLVRAIKRWSNDPAVDQWCAAILPEFVRSNLLRLGQWVRYGQSIIHVLIELTRLDSRQVTNLILSGLAANAEGLYASLALPLVELLVSQLEPDDAVILAEWYSERLVQHIPSNERDLIDASDVPVDSASGIARYPRQNGLAVALRELGRIERTLLILS